jgi:hypothetical protein
MFKKMITMMMVVSIFTVNAYAASNSGLKAAFDELNYALSVEWNQKDQEFYSAQMKKFSEVVHDLQAKGLTNSQLIDFVKAEVKDEKVARDMQTALTMISIQKMSPSEAADYMSKTMKNSYAKGASWSGDATMLLLGVGVLAIVIAVALSGSYSGGGNGCYDYYTCDTYCYSDYYWGYTCRDDCYYTCY